MTYIKLLCEFVKNPHTQTQKFWYLQGRKKLKSGDEEETERAILCNEAKENINVTSWIYFIDCGSWTQS